MITRRSFLRNGVVASSALFGASFAFTACSGGPLMSELRVSASEIVPDGSGKFTMRPTYPTVCRAELK